jgi:hypothetical protein
MYFMLRGSLPFDSYHPGKLKKKKKKKKIQNKNKIYS